MTKALASVSVAALLAAAAWSAPALAQSEVKIGLIQPLSGPWARSGEMSKRGAELAVEDINNAGGVKACGGAKVKLVVVDAGDSPEKAKNAAQRLVAQDPDVAGGIGSNISSFTLAVTEVTERAGVPWMTLSFSPVVTDRGFQHVFQSSMTGDKQAEVALPTVLKMAEAAGVKPSKLGIVMDNTASPVAFTKDMRAPGYLDKYGLKLVVDETFTPPLSDAGPIMQRVRAARPDFVFLLPTVVSDIKLTMEKATEIGLGRNRLQMIESGGPPGSPDLLKIAGKEQLEGLMFVTANWPNKQTLELAERFKKVTGEPWMPQDSISNYGHVWIFKEAMEAAGSCDKAKVSEALHKIDLKTGPATLFPGGRIKFDEKGRRVDADIVVVQWQDGEPKLVYPAAVAAAPAKWAKP
jgi:branched-chain amino acid transport system substrate-binding protein